MHSTHDAPADPGLVTRAKAEERVIEDSVNQMCDTIANTERATREPAVRCILAFRQILIVEGRI